MDNARVCLLDGKFSTTNYSKMEARFASFQNWEMRV